MSLDSRIKKAESAISEIGCDKEVYIEAMMSYYRGDEGKALAALPPFKGSLGERAALWINALSRVKNEAKERGNI